MNNTWELKIYWDDNCTVECRYFPTKKEALKYAKDNGIDNYTIVKENDYRYIKTY